MFLILREEKLLLALEKIDRNTKGFLIVVDSNERVLGTLTDGDIRRGLLAGKSVQDSVVGFYNEIFKYIHDDELFENVITCFRERDIQFLPILDRNFCLKNIITKKTMQALLLQDIQPDLRWDFLGTDDSIIDYEIFEKPWGFYKTTIMSELFQSKIISVKPKNSLSLQEHEAREEHWIIVNGEGEVQLGKSIIPVKGGSSLFIPKGCKHRIINKASEDNLIFIEVQLGEYFGEDDIKRFEDEYGRV